MTEGEGVRFYALNTLFLPYGVVLIIFVWQRVLVRQLSETWPPGRRGAWQLFLPPIDYYELNANLPSSLAHKYKRHWLAIKYAYTRCFILLKGRCKLSTEQ